MSEELDQAEREVREAQEQLRDAIRRADRANHQRSVIRRREAGEFEDAEFSAEQIEFMEQAVMVDYVVGAWYGQLGGGRDYHTVLDTDGACSRHRSVGLSRLTTRFLESP